MRLSGRPSGSRVFWLPPQPATTFASSKPSPAAAARWTGTLLILGGWRTRSGRAETAHQAAVVRERDDEVRPGARGGLVRDIEEPRRRLEPPASKRAARARAFAGAKPSQSLLKYAQTGRRRVQRRIRRAH